MASFVKMIVSGKNGKSTDVNGKRKSRVSVATFVHIAKECNGDIRKMAEEHNLNQPAQAVLGRYKNLLKKGVELPKYTFVKLREHTEFTPEMLQKGIQLWNDSKGDAKYVAETLGVSVQTLTNWIKKLDKECLEKNILYIRQKHNVDREEAINMLEKQGGYVSLTCEKKVSPRGKQAAKLDSKITEGLDSLIESELENMMNSPEEKTGEEKLLDVMIEKFEEEISAT